MSEPTCSYHSDRVAVDKCERCKKMICLECKTVFHTKSKDGFRLSVKSNRGSRLRIGTGGRFRTSRTGAHTKKIEMKVCPVCNFELQEERESASNKIMYLFWGFGVFLALILAMILIPMIAEIGKMSETSDKAAAVVFLLVVSMMFIFPFLIILFIVYKAFGSNPKIQTNARAEKEAFLRSVGQSSLGSSTHVTSSTNKASNFCRKCGDELRPGDQFCPNCGVEN